MTTAAITPALEAFLAQLRRERPTYTCARFSDGRLGRLSKECGCITHKGPRFLHTDAYYRKANVDLFLSIDPSSISMLTFHAFAQEEAARLRELGHNLRSQGITELFTEDQLIAMQAAGETIA